jgi:phosphatidylglycerol:prolipoprotein diacylglycerol transferase
MHPVLFTIKGITVYSYSFFISLGLLFAFLLFLFEVRRRGFDVGLGVNLNFWALISALIGAKLLYLIENLGYLSKNPNDIYILLKGGMATHGALLGALLAILIIFRKRKLNGFLWADMCAPSVALGQAVGRVGCLMAGCCYGLPTSLPWGIVFTKSHIAPIGIPLHPTQIYQIILNLLIFGFLFLRRKKVSFNGELILSYVFLYTAARSVVGIFRAGVPQEFFGLEISATQIINLVAVIIAAILYYRIRGKRIDKNL